MEIHSSSKSSLPGDSDLLWAFARVPLVLLVVLPPSLQMPTSEADLHKYRRSSRGEMPSPFGADDHPPPAAKPPSPPPLNMEQGGPSGARKESREKSPERPRDDARKVRAFDPDGPVEATALQSDWQFWSIYTDIRTLGKGHFAKVKEVEHQETGERFAAKILDKTMADNDIEDLVREFQMLRALRHPNIIRLYAAYETPRKLYLVTELSTGGELMKRLGSDNSVYSEDDVRRHVLTILKAVEYMHSKQCAHRDLKPENVSSSAEAEQRRG